MKIFAIWIFEDTIDRMAAKYFNLDSLFFFEGAAVDLTKDIPQKSPIDIFELLEFLIRRIQLRKSNVYPQWLL